MFHLTGRVCLGMNIGNLFQLEGTFHGDRPHGSATKEQCVLLDGKILCQLLQLVAHLEREVRGGSSMRKVRNEFSFLFFRQAAMLRHHQRDNEYGQQLSGKRLGACDADFGSCLVRHAAAID